MLSEKLKTISENYKGLTKEEVDELTIENIFMKLVNDKVQSLESDIDRLKPNNWYD